jgi:uncharacterized membrane protein
MRVTLFTRPDCHLCDLTKADLAELQPVAPHHLVEVDIETDPVLLKRHGESVPVVEIGPYTLRPPFSKTDLKVALLAAQQRLSTRPPLTGAARQRAIGANRVVHGFSKHWLAVLNTIVFLYVALPFFAPVLMKAGATVPARWIYTVYSPVCHQLAFRSWFLFGEQSAYPRALAGTALISYGEATGLPEDDLLSARNFLGDDRLGYKVAFCERDVAIYGGILLGGLVFALVRRRLKPLPVLVWFLVGVLPMLVDGGSHCSPASSPAGGLGAAESTPLLRTATGMLFGIMNVWLAYPYLEQSMSETRASAAVNLAGADPGPPPT